MDYERKSNNEAAKIKIINIEEANLNKLFVHYTNVDNLDSILANGLEPRVGDNSMVIERNKKVFFVVGDKGMLVIMDVWLRWLRLRPKNKLIYGAGAFFITKPYFPKFVYDLIFSRWHRSERKINNACKELSEILDKSVFLALDLKEGEDFGPNDVDEVKAQKISRKHLEYIYPHQDSLDSERMEYWNMHTYSDKVIESGKISLIKIGDDQSAQKILKYVFEKNKQFAKENCPFLVKYFDSITQE